MKSFRLFAAICAVAVSAGAAKTANAAATTYLVGFMVSNFQQQPGTLGPAPVDPVKGSVLITLDPTVQSPGFGTGTGTVNIPGLPGSVGFFRQEDGLLTMCVPPYGLAGACGQPGRSTFWIYMNNFPFGPNFRLSGYATASGSWYSSTGSLSCSRPTLICYRRGLPKRCHRIFLPCGPPP